MPQTLEIPLPVENNTVPSSFKIRTVLDGVEYVLLFNWNGREQLWNLSIMDASEAPIIMGMVLAADMELIGRFSVNGMPPGLLQLYDTSGNQEDAGRNDLGTRHRLFYQTNP